MRELALARAARVVNGGTPTADPENWDGDVPWVTPADMRQLRDGRFVDRTARQITVEGLRQGSALAPRGSVLLSTRAPIGYVAEVTSPVAFNQGCKALVPGPGVDQQFLAYLLRGSAGELESRGRGTTFTELSSGALRSLRVAMPPLEIQRTVARHLAEETAEIDAFIADQEQLIALLEERRDAAWGRLAGGCGMELVPLRRLITSIADGPFGSSLASKHYADSGVRVIRLGNIGINEFKDTDRVYIDPAHARELEGHSVRQGDVVVAGLGDSAMPLGRAAVVPAIGPAIVKADCYRVRPNGRVTSEFLAWALSSPVCRAPMLLLARGSTRARLNTSVVLDAAVPWVDPGEQGDVLEAWRTEAASIDAAIADARESIALSTEWRVALISAAVTGRIDVTKRKRVLV